MEIVDVIGDDNRGQGISCMGTCVTPRFPNNVNNTHNQSIQRKTGYHATFKI